MMSETLTPLKPAKTPTPRHRQSEMMMKWWLEGALVPRGLFMACTMHCVLFLAPFGLANGACTYYVAPNGDDAWDGTTPSHVGGINGPFASLVRAQQAVRGRANGISQHCEVLLRAGVYHLNETLTMNSLEDSNVLWATYPADLPSRATVSGAVEISGFVKGTGDCLMADLPSQVQRFSQLFVSGERRQRARLPNAPMSAYDRGLGDNSTYHWERPLEPCSNRDCNPWDGYGFVYSGEDIKATWHNLEEVQLVVFQAWTALWHSIAAVFEANHTVLFEHGGRAIGEFSWACHGGKCRYVVENVLEGLDSPGEWYADFAERKLHYCQTPDDPPYIVASAPQVTTLVALDGGVHDITLQDLVLRYAAGDTDRLPYFPSFGVVQITKASKVTLLRCDVGSSGANGVLLDGDGSQVKVLDSRLSDVGADGLSIHSSTVGDFLINNTLVDNVGLIFMCQPGGVNLKGKKGIVATHNKVSRSSYAGIKVGWQMGRADPWLPSQPPVFTIDRNHVTDYGLGILSDFGGIYLSSADNLCFEHGTCVLPSLVSNNHIERGSHNDYGSEGIYMDEQVAGVRMEGNLIHDVGDSGIYFHCGNNHSFTNNIVVRAAQKCGGYVKSCNNGGNPTWPNITQEFVFERNVVYVTRGCGVDSDYRNTTFDHNVYWADDPKDLVFPGGVPWSKWASKGNERDSVVANPMFADVDRGNFTLLPGSPALKLGFVPLAMEEIGPHGNPFGE